MCQVAQVVVLFLVLARAGCVIPAQELKCEPIKLELCTHYKSTGMPNFMGDQRQGDAKAGLETFMPLIQFGCSPDLQFFLCSVHVPMCVSLPPTQDTEEPAHQLIGPCRPLCQRVKDSCLRILQNFNKEWPAALNCEKFPPTNNHEHMCMDGGNTSRGNRPFVGSSSAFNSLQNYPELISKYKDISKEKPELAIYDPIIRILENSVHNIKPAQGFSGKCTGVAFPVHHHYVNRTDECVPRCGADILFDKEDKYFASIWLAVWSVLCFLSTTFTLTTFLLDTSRFLYPEKCIIFLNLSYNILSLGYLVRLAVGAEGVSCMTIPGGPSLLVKEGLTPTPACTVVFILLYFATLSSAIWWAITTTTWAVMVFCSLDQQSLDSKSPLFHFLGWGVPAIQTAAALVLHQVEGDELTGVCFPGQQTESTLLHQLVIPHCIFLGSAFIFFLSGMVASLISPSDLTRKLMGRISVFFILYTLPQVCVVGSLVYELIERKHWRQDAKNRPNIEVFILRIFMWLIVGITSGSWVWSHKTLVSWKNLVRKCFGFWTGAKKPPTPVFPKVAYHATAGDTSGEVREDVVTLENLATLKRGKDLRQEGLPFLIDDKRVVLGCIDNNRIVL